MIYEARSRLADAVATCSADETRARIRIRFPWSALSAPPNPFSLHGTRSLPFTTLSKYFLPRPFSRRGERERGRKGLATNGIREVVFPMCSTHRTREVTSLQSCQSYNYPTPNTWPGQGSVPLKMHVRRNRETLLSTWFVLRFRFKVSR